MRYLVDRELEIVPESLERDRRFFAKAEPPLGNRAKGFLLDVISAALVGKETEAADVLGFALQWACRAIEINEDWGPQQGAHQLYVKRTRAVAGWLSGAPEQPVWWAELADHHARYYAELESRLRPNDATAVHIEQLLFRAHAHQPELAQAYYEQRLGPAATPMTSTSSATRVALAYALATRTTPPKPDALHRAGRRILTAKLESQWLHNGNYIDAAIWLKLVYGGPGSTLSPAQVIRKAYENMPNTPWPDFLPAE